VHDVAVAHNVVLALEAELPRLPVAADLRHLAVLLQLLGRRTQVRERELGLLREKDARQL
jgi:hypothetical protein